MNIFVFEDKRQHRRLISIIVLAVVCIVVYANSLFNGFVYDDYPTIVENPHIQELAENIPSFFNLNYFKIAGIEASYRPVATFSYYLLFQIFGLNAFGYHLASLMIHILNVLLVYVLASRILEDRWSPLIAGLLFACHPALTEAINCISYNEDLLAAVFFLLALVLYLTLSTKNYVLSLICFLLGLLSKEMVITLPAIIVLYDMTFNRLGDNQTLYARSAFILKKRIGYYTGYLGVSLFYLYLRFGLFYVQGDSIAPQYGDLIDRIIYLPYHLFNYVKLSVSPVNLSADYVFAYPESFLSPVNLMALSFVLLILVSSFLIAKSSKAIAFGIWWFFITLLPVLNLIQIYNPFAERYVYLPLVGFCLVLSTGIAAIADRLTLRQKGRVAVITFSIAAVVLILYSMLTIPRNFVWKNGIKLWTDTIERTPASSRAHGNLGRHYEQLGMTEEAIGEYKKAIELNSNDYKSHYNLGIIYYRRGKADAAIRAYERAIKNNPRYVDAYFNLGNILKDQQRLVEASRAFERVVELKPDDVEARNNLGVLYAMQGKLEMAISEWEKVLAADPGNRDVRDNIARAKGMLDK